MASTIELLIERPVAGGDMLARHDGQVVLIRGVIPGERVTARIVRQSKGVAWAELLDVLEPSPDRRPLTFDPACGGAHFAHIQPDRQRALKSEIIADAFRRIGKIMLPGPVEVRPSPETGYRLRARLHIRNRQVGFVRDGTHSLCDARPCGQLRPDSLAAAQRAVAALGSQADFCGAVTVAEDTSATSRVIHFQGRPESGWNPNPDSSLRVDGVTGITAQAGSAFTVLAGSPRVVQTAAALSDIDVHFDPEVQWGWRPTSFFQGNRFLLGSLLRNVLEQARGDVVADLYAGVGLFSVALAARGARVFAVEGDESSGADLVENLHSYSSRGRVVRAAVEAALEELTTPVDAVIVDPPRTGMSVKALELLVRWQPRRIVYVSCDPPTLARDAKDLKTAGYGLHKVGAFDLFPNSAHVEAVAVFDIQP